MVKQKKIYGFRRNSIAFNFASMSLLLMELSFKGNFPYFADGIVANHSSPEEKNSNLPGFAGVHYYIISKAMRLSTR